MSAKRWVRSGRWSPTGTCLVLGSAWGVVVSPPSQRNDLANCNLVMGAPLLDAGEALGCSRPHKLRTRSASWRRTGTTLADGALYALLSTASYRPHRRMGGSWKPLSALTTTAAPAGVWEPFWLLGAVSRTSLRPTCGISPWVYSEPTRRRTRRGTSSSSRARIHLIADQRGCRRKRCSARRGRGAACLGLLARGRLNGT